MDYPKIIYQIKEHAGKPYRPSNGTEGMTFDEFFCSQCIHQSHDPDSKKQCDILCRALVYDLNDKEYPKEWKYSQEGWPICTAWIKWDWGNDGDPDDPDNPKAPPPPPGPNQLDLFPLYPDEKQFDYENREVQRCIDSI